MRIDHAEPAVLGRALDTLGRRARRCGEPLISYLDCGTRVVRLICHSPAFFTHVRRQMTCALRDEADRYDATLVIWQERSVTAAALDCLRHLDGALYRRLRLERLAGGEYREHVQCFDEAYSRHWPLLDVNPRDRSLSACDPSTNVYYYAVEDLAPEEFIKRGHIFVQLLFRICNVPGSSLAHGAVIGLNDIGVLFCAFGYRGKSTLCVHALMDGFEYVSDDYFILGKRGEDWLRAWPVYSVIALSPQAWTAMYDTFKGKFLSNNGRKDKYMFNIAAYHERFRRGYPVHMCMFPHICDCAEPSIEPGFKSLAVEELAFSTLNNTGDLKDAMTIGKLYGFVNDLPFYRFNLSRNIAANTRCLRQFLETRQAGRPSV